MKRSRFYPRARRGAGPCDQLPRRARISVPAIPPNIVLITIDTLRADRIGRGFTPAIDALASTGVRFDNARTTVPLTLPSHVTIMTGLLPVAHGVRDNGVVFAPQPSAPTLARRLREAGYRTGAFVGAYVLDRRFGLADGFDTYDDRIRRDPDEGARLEAERPGAEVVDAAVAWLKQTDVADSSCGCISTIRTRPTSRRPNTGRRPAAMPTTARWRTRMRRSRASSSDCGRAACWRRRSSP